MKKIFSVIACCFVIGVNAETTADIAARIKARERIRQTGEFAQMSQGGRGYVKFDHTKNNGQYTIYSDGKKFLTSWSGCFPGKIYAYREWNGLIGYREGYDKFPSSPNEFERVMDFSNRAATVNVGDVALFVNASGDFLAVRLLSVKYVDRGDDEYCVEFEYKVY